MEAKYNPEITDNTDQYNRELVFKIPPKYPQFQSILEHWANLQLEKYKEQVKDNLEEEFKNFFLYGESQTHYNMKQAVSLPKLCTIETYDELIKYVEDMYVNGMILGDEFVMKPSEEQKSKFSNSFLSVGTRGIIASLEYTQNAKVMILYTHFGVKIFIK